MSILAGIQEGEEWLAKLNAELSALTNDLETFRDSLSQYTINGIEYCIQQTMEAMTLISLEMQMLEESL